MEGKENSALEFDGIDDWIEVYDSASLSPQDEITIAAWIRLPGKGGGPIIYKSPGYLLEIKGDKIRFVLDGIHPGKASEIVGKTKLPPDIWVHIAATYDSNIMKVYLNTAVDGTSNWTSNIYVSSSNLMIARSDTNAYFHGVIDELKIYNRALTDEEIKAHYEGKELKE